MNQGAGMNESSILRLFDQERQSIEDRDVTLIQTRYTVRAIGPKNSWAGIAYYSFSSEETERVINGEIEFFEKLGLEFEWKVYSHDQPKGLLAELGCRGFRIGEEEALVIGDLRETRPGLERSATPGIRVSPVVDEQGVTDYIAVESTLWPESKKMRDQLLAMLKEPEQRNIAFVAYEEEKPIGCGRVTIPRESRFAGLWGGAVLPDFRGKGVYRALLSARINHVSRFDSVQYLRVDALPTTRPILEKYGFRQISSTWPASL